MNGFIECRKLARSLALEKWAASITSMMSRYKCKPKKNPRRILEDVPTSAQQCVQGSFISRGLAETKVLNGNSIIA
jgi:hypothetical protein